MILRISCNFYYRDKITERKDNLKNVVWLMMCIQSTVSWVLRLSASGKKNIMVWPCAEQTGCLMIARKQPDTERSESRSNSSLPPAKCGFPVNAIISWIHQWIIHWLGHSSQIQSLPQSSSGGDQGYNICAFLGTLDSDHNGIFSLVCASVPISYFTKNHLFCVLSNCFILQLSWLIYIIAVFNISMGLLSYA